MENRIFNTKECAKEIIQVLEKHNATISDMKEVFKCVKKEASLKTPVRDEAQTKAMIDYDMLARAGKELRKDVGYTRVPTMLAAYRE